jgi:transposase
MGTRRNFSAAFKAKVSLEALVGDKTLADLAAKHEVHPNMIAQWKRQAKESLPKVFAKKSSRGATDHEAEVKSLHAKIGQLTVENDVLSKAFGR